MGRKERELQVIATDSQCRICTFCCRNHPVEGLQTRLLWGPLGTTGDFHTLLWNGTHYDLLTLTREQLNMLGLRS